jgi:hypothetical protein
VLSPSWIHHESVFDMEYSERSKEVYPFRLCDY